MAKIVFFSKVVSVERHEKQIYVGGFGQDAKFIGENKGYFLLLEGSYEALHIGFEMPAFRVGDRIKITMEKVNA